MQKSNPISPVEYQSTTTAKLELPGGKKQLLRKAVFTFPVSEKKKTPTLRNK